MAPSTSEDRTRSIRSSLRSSHRSSTTRSSSTDLESYRLSLASDVDPIEYHPASTWNPISSIQSSGFFHFNTEELEALDRQSDDDDEDRKRRDPPEVSQAIHALVPWEEVDEGFKKTDESSSTAELSDPPSDESDVEPCEEHYRIPPAKEEPVVLEQQIVCRSDPPDDAAAAVHKSKEELIHRINTQLALVPSSSQYNGYRHHFITVKEQHRFLLLYNFLKRNLQSKIILYFSTTKSTQYHAKLLHQLQFEVKYVHNGQSKEKFLDTYLSFSKQKQGILCLPDFQGKELATPPTVSWIVQYEPPQDPTEYIFRIGRISAERSSSGNKALLFLTPDQSRFLTYFKAARVKIYEYEMHNLNNVQRHYEKLVKREERLNTMGREAYHSYLLDYASHEYRDVYDVHGLCKDLVAKSFGFDKAPSSSGEREGSRKVSHREENRWKPNKKENGDQWLNREERSWKHASRHEHLMKKERIRS